MLLFIVVIACWLISVVWLWVVAWRRTRHWPPSVGRAALRSAVVAAALAVGGYGGGMFVVPAPASLAFLVAIYQLAFSRFELTRYRTETIVQAQVALIALGAFWLIAFLITLWHQRSVARSRQRLIHSVRRVSS